MQNDMVVFRGVQVLGVYHDDFWVAEPWNTELGTYQSLQTEWLPRNQITILKAYQPGRVLLIDFAASKALADRLKLKREQEK